MAHPYHHALSSVKKWGGTVDDGAGQGVNPRWLASILAVWHPPEEETGGWFRDGFQGGRGSPAARRGVIPMTAAISQTAFRGPGDNFVGGVLARLRLVDRMPLRVSYRCRAHWDHPRLDQQRFEREVDLGTSGDLASAMTVARNAVASGQIDAGRDADLCLVPQFVTILDAEHGLVLAGEVQAGSIGWCTPVNSDAEARSAVLEACGFRAKARAATDAGEPASAAALLTRAQALEGRLVDPFWRDLAAAAVDLALAA